MRALLFLAFTTLALAGPAGTFVGSTPADEPVRRALGIADPATELIEWKLTLDNGRYTLDCVHGRTLANHPGAGTARQQFRRQGPYSLGESTIQLDNRLAFRQVGPDLLLLLSPENGLPLRGNGGWSYTLNRSTRTEPKVDPEAARHQPEISYRLTPLAQGDEVVGVFEGRTPCQGIARELRREVHPGCMKAKWRVTLYRTRFKAEGSLFRGGPLESVWRREANGDLILAPGLRLGWLSDDLVHFLGSSGDPLVGTDEFSYTLSRRIQ